VQRLLPVRFARSSRITSGPMVPPSRWPPRDDHRARARRSQAASARALRRPSANEPEESGHFSRARRRVWRKSPATASRSRARRRASVKRVRHHLAVTTAPHVDTTVGGVALAGKNLTALGGKRPPEPNAIFSDFGGDTIEIPTHSSKACAIRSVICAASDDCSSDSGSHRTGHHAPRGAFRRLVGERLVLSARGPGVAPD
jgi:hypothetical protein